MGWQDLSISGGGNVASIDINQTDGTIFQCGDVFGAWISNVANAGSNGNWQQLLTAASLPSTNAARVFWTGAYAAKSAPSNPNTIVVVYPGGVEISGGSVVNGVLISRDKGATFTRISGITSSVPGVNAAQDAFFGGMIVFNPSDDSEFYVSVTDGGLWHCTSYGSSCTRLDPGTVPAATSGFGYYGMSWLGSTIIVGVYGSGAYISTNSGGTWAASSGSPTQILTGGFASDGTYFGLNNNNGTQSGTNVHRRTTGGTWSSFGPGTTWWNGLAIDPNNKDHIAIITFDGTTNVSSNATGSATWQTNNSAWTMVNGDTPWMAWSFNGNFSYLNANNCAFDTSGRFWVAIGIGVVYATSLPNSGTATSYTPMTQGSEGLAANWARWVPGGPMLMSAWDRPGWVVSNPNITQSTFAPDNASTIRYGDAIDYAQSDNTFFVMNAGSLYKSSNSGSSWSVVTNSSTALTGGSCALAIFSPTQYVVSDKSSGNVAVTSNAGTSWTVTPTGLPAGGFAWSGNNVHNLCYDSVTAGTAYIVSTAGTVYSTTNYGASWSQVSSTGALSISGAARLKAVVGKAGHLFFAVGNPSNAPSGQPASTTAYLMFSNDGGVTWTGVTNSGYLLTTPWDVATTPSAPGQSYPSVAVYGWMKTAGTGALYVLDVWRCDNFSGTTTMTGNVWSQMNWTMVAQPACIEGNPSTYNQWILANNSGDSGMGFSLFLDVGTSPSGHGRHHKIVSYSHQQSWNFIR